MEHEDLLPCFQQPITGPYPEPARYSPPPHTISFTPILESSPIHAKTLQEVTSHHSHLVLHTFLISPMCATCSTHLISLI